jgi:hypothetical protein
MYSILEMCSMFIFFPVRCVLNRKEERRTKVDALLSVVPTFWPTLDGHCCWRKVGRNHK